MTTAAPVKMPAPIAQANCAGGRIRAKQAAEVVNQVPTAVNGPALTGVLMSDITKSTLARFFLDIRVPYFKIVLKWYLPVIEAEPVNTVETFIIYSSFLHSIVKDNKKSVWLFSL